MLDNWLPDGSVIKLCREIRALHPDAPIIFVSGITRKKETQEALDAGANEYLVKPCDPDKLQKVVKELIEK
jgi:DNA-binding response OmpR family regulator